MSVSAKIQMYPTIAWDQRYKRENNGGEEVQSCVKIKCHQVGQGKIPNKKWNDTDIKRQNPYIKEYSLKWILKDYTRKCSSIQDVAYSDRIHNEEKW